MSGLLTEALTLGIGLRECIEVPIVFRSPEA